MVRTKKEKRKFFLANNYGSGLLRCFSVEYGTTHPKEDIGDKFIDEERSKKECHEVYWVLAKEYDCPIVIYDDYCHHGYAAYIPSEGITCPIMDKTIISIIVNKFGNIKTETIAVPDSYWDRGAYNGRGGYVDKPPHVKDVYVIHGLKTKIRKQGCSYNLVILD